MKKNYFIPFILLFCLNLSAQVNDQFWSLKEQVSEKAASKISKSNLPIQYEVYELNLKDFKNHLNNAPSRKGLQSGSNVVMSFPTANGGLDKFEIFEASVMADDLQRKYPDIKSFIGKSIETPGAIIRFSITKSGLNGLILGNGEGDIVIEPDSRNNSTYLVYASKNLSQGLKQWACEVDETIQSTPWNKQNTSSKSTNADDGRLRTYRLAIACTGEYTQFHADDQGLFSGDSDAAKRAAALSAVVATITSVNAIYERDLSVTLQLISNNEDIIFTDSTTDNLANDDKYTLINQSQQVLDATVGNSSYDIGHVFTKSGLGGLATIRGLCSLNKGRGVSGTSNPKGTGFNNLVAHEFGHQFGATHTFNATDIGSCNDANRSAATAVEPGSGSTIMSYAGTCSPFNVTYGSDSYFHAVSIDQMWSYITKAIVTCASQSVTNNNTPIIDAFQTAYSLPIGTPFVLDVLAVDADDDIMTYSWEQMDNELVTPPQNPLSTVGPLFRSYPPNSSSKRFFPNLNTVTTPGVLSNEWEVLPMVARSMKFHVTVRDNNINGGQTTSNDLVLEFIDGDPFKVTSQPTVETWVVGETKTITWNVGNTNAAPINASNVTISLSLDGGFTYPIDLANSVPNDGSQDIVVPDVATSGARIKVSADFNVFYSLNSGYIEINPVTDKTFVPDDAFESALITIGLDDVMDDYVLNSSIENITFLELNNFRITNFKGIEGFKNLENFKTTGNIDLAYLNLNENVKLTDLHINGGKFTSLDLSSNPLLQHLTIYNTNLETINLFQNTALQKLDLRLNKLVTLDLINNLNINELLISNNSLSSLDVSNQTGLITLNTTSNPLTCVQVNQVQLDLIPVGWAVDSYTDYSLNCSGLTYIADSNFEQALIDLGLDQIKDNYVTTSKISAVEELSINGKVINDLTGIQDFVSLRSLEAKDNQIFALNTSELLLLEILDIRNNQLTSIDVSMLDNLNYFLSTGNQLACIQVSELQYGNIPVEWLKDESTVYAVDCNNLPKTNVPDDNFEQALIDLGYDDVLDDYVNTGAISNLDNLDIGFYNILDLSGIEDFTGLKSLNISNNNLSVFLITKDTHPNLEYLNCSSNLFTNLVITEMPNLLEVECYENPASLVSFEITNNPELVKLQITGGEATNLDIRNNPNLEKVYAANHQFDSITLSGSTSLFELHISNNRFTGLDIDFPVNAELELLDISNNLLNNLDVSGLEALSTLDATNNPDLTCIKVNDTQYNAIPANWTKDSIAEYSLDCNSTGLTYVPDDKFEQALIDLGHDDVLDDYVLTATISSLESLDLGYLGIEDLTGIENFSSLKSLNISDNALTIFPITKDTHPLLEYLNCSSNQFINLVIKEMPNLINVECYENFASLVSFEITNNPKLVKLQITGGEATNLDISNNPNLEKVYAANHQFDSITLSGSTSLFELYISNNRFTGLDIDFPANAELELLDISNNLLNNLDVSGLEALVTLDATNNPDLTCIQVNDTQYNAIPANWTKDNTAEYSLDCNNAGLTYVPDDNFESHLISLGLDDVLDDYVYTNAIDTVQVLEIPEMSISDLTGIEGFADLKKLDAKSNMLTTVDLSENIHIQDLNLSLNQLTSTIGIGNLPNLFVLNLESNQLDVIDVYDNYQLQELFIGDNAIPSLDVSGNPNLFLLSAFDNQLIELDLLANTELVILDLYNNNIENLDLSNNTKLFVLYLAYNRLTTVNLQFMSELVYLWVAGNLLTELDVSSNTKLDRLWAEFNNISSIDLSLNTQLTDLDLSGNQLSKLELFDHPLLEVLWTYNNLLTELNLGELGNLKILRAQNNALSMLNLEYNTLLTIADISNNQLELLDVSFNVDLAELNSTGNGPLSCIQVNQAQLAAIPVSWSKDNDVEYLLDCTAQELTFVPDDNFEQALIDQGYDNILDDYVVTANISGIESLDIGYLDIADLTGIEDFTSLKSLNISDNDLTVLPITKDTHPNLEYLNCSSNLFTNLVITEMPNLIEVECYENSATLISFEITNNPMLTLLQITGGEATNLDIRNNPSLEKVYASNHQFDSVSLSGSTNLFELYISDNRFTGLEIDFPSNAELEVLDISNNLLNNLDVSGLEALSTLTATNNPDLTCIQVNSTQYSAIPAGWSKDESAEYSLDCSTFAMTYVPDDNFENYLISVGLDDVLDDYVETAKIATLEYIDAPNNNISDLTGIGDFTNLLGVDVAGNQLTNIDVYDNFKLEQLDVSDNQLSFLDVSGNPSLTLLYATGNPNLACIQVSETQLNNIPTEWLKDEITVYAINCGEALADDDLDGILNIHDLCADTPAGEDVNDSGCSESQIDDDGDGIMNNLDTCPDSPSGASVDETGCAESQKDDDGDGIMNDVDVCADTPTGETIDENGCSESQKDDDGDGVVNSLDGCDGTPLGEDVDNNGCAESQKDDDGDGIKNSDDQCSNTASGATVDENGCAIFTVPADNFTIETTGETCPDKDNGQLSISAKESHDYQVTINGDTYSFTDNLNLENVSPGDLEFCISVVGENFEQCFNLTIEEGTTVSGKSVTTKNRTTVEMLQGTAPYKVYLNGKPFMETTNTIFSIDVNHGDLIEVKTAIDCEGVYAKTIELFDQIIAYPNPTQGVFEIAMPILVDKVEIEIHNFNGQLISKKTYDVNYGKVSLSLENQSVGVYTALILLDQPVSLKIVKN